MANSYWITESVSIKASNTSTNLSQGPSGNLICRIVKLYILIVKVFNKMVNILTSEVYFIKSEYEF